MTRALLAALLLSACAAPPITDDALKAAGRWTDGDAAARRLLDLEAPASQDGTWPTRRRTRAEKLDPLGLLGFDYEPRYRYVASLDAWVLIHPGRPPTVLSADPERPLVLPVEPTDPRAYDAAEDRLERDVERLLDPPPGSGVP